MSIYSVVNNFRLGRDPDGNTTYGTKFYIETFNTYCEAGIEKTVSVPNNQFNWALFTYEPGGNSILIKPDDGVAIIVPTNSIVQCTAEFNPPLKYVQGDTGLRMLSVLGAAITISFVIGSPL